jgi:hypothetical protein
VGSRGLGGAHRASCSARRIARVRADLRRALGSQTFLARLVALVTGKLSPKAGYFVEVPAALAVLAERNPRAAAWWRENAPHLVQPRKYFIFPDGVGRVTDDAKA